MRARSLGLVAAAVRALARTPEITVGALGVVVAAAFSWVPSLWYDEAATVASAQRSWPALWAELQNVDAVHGLYYAVMHVWFTLVGYSPFTLRFPSALAIGVSAGLVVALGRRLGGVRLGVVSGIVFLVLPRVAWAGTEGRPYATVTTFAVALTLVGITAVRRTRIRHHATRWWVVYGMLAAVAPTWRTVAHPTPVIQPTCLACPAASTMNGDTTSAAPTAPTPQRTNAARSTIGAATGPLRSESTASRRAARSATAVQRSTTPCATTARAR